MIIRAPHKSNYSVIDNRVLNDERLSWRARGLLAYLLSKPDGWQVMTQNLVNSSPDGRRIVEVTMTELETLGYVERPGQLRNDRGRFDSVTTIVREEPISGVSEGFEDETPGRHGRTSTVHGGRRDRVPTTVVSSPVDVPLVNTDGVSTEEVSTELPSTEGTTSQDAFGALPVVSKTRGSSPSRSDQNSHETVSVPVKKRSSKSKLDPELAEALAKADRSVILDLFNSWVLTGKGRAHPSEERLGHIARALVHWSFSVEDVRDALTGWVNDPWEERSRFKDVSYLVGSVEQVEKFRDLKRNPPVKKRDPGAGLRGNFGDSKRYEDFDESTAFGRRPAEPQVEVMFP
jgi:hypothetical protein